MEVDMDYHDACEAIVSRQEARLELEAHGALFYEFTIERGDRDEYYGYEILNYLGYLMYFITFMIVWAVLVVLVWRGIWKATQEDRRGPNDEWGSW